MTASNAPIQSLCSEPPLPPRWAWTTSSSEVNTVVKARPCSPRLSRTKAPLPALPSPSLLPVSESPYQHRAMCPRSQTGALHLRCLPLPPPPDPKPSPALPPPAHRNRTVTGVPAPGPTPWHRALTQPAGCRLLEGRAQVQGASVSSLPPPPRLWFPASSSDGQLLNE